MIDQGPDQALVLGVWSIKVGDGLSTLDPCSPARLPDCLGSSRVKFDP